MSDRPEQDPSGVDDQPLATVIPLEGRRKNNGTTTATTPTGGVASVTVLSEQTRPSKLCKAIEEAFKKAAEGIECKDVVAIANHDTLTLIERFAAQNDRLAEIIIQGIGKLKPQPGMMRTAVEIQRETEPVKQRVTGSMEMAILCDIYKHIPKKQQTMDVEAVKAICQKAFDLTQVDNMLKAEVKESSLVKELWQQAVGNVTQTLQEQLGLDLSPPEPTR